MDTSDTREPYRAVIDHLVRSCREGQGQIGPRRVRAGVWNTNASAVGLDDQRDINVMLEKLTPSDRDVLAGMLSDVFEGGVHEALVVLHESGIPPFEDGYEATPFHVGVIT